MTTPLERLRETVAAGMPDNCTIDGTHYKNFLPLTYGDARALLALVRACEAWQQKCDDLIAARLTDDAFDKMCEESDVLREAMLAAVVEVTG